MKKKKNYSTMRRCDICIEWFKASSKNIGKCDTCRKQESSKSPIFFGRERVLPAEEVWAQMVRECR